MKRALNINHRLSINSLSVAMTSALLLGVAALPSQAVVRSFHLAQFADYVQTSNAQPVSGSYNLTSLINYSDLADLNTANVNVLSFNGQSSFPLSLNFSPLFHYL